MSDIDAARGRVLEAGQRIRGLLAKDAAVFAVGCVREAFVEHPSFADDLDGAALKTLKASAAEAGAQAAAHLERALHDNVWLRASVPDEPGAGVLSIPEVAVAVGEVDALVATVFADHRLPGAPAEWKLPVRFIDGDDLVSLTRSLWKAIGQLREVERSIAAEAEASSVEERRRRWDDA